MRPPSTFPVIAGSDDQTDLTLFWPAPPGAPAKGVWRPRHEGAAEELPRLVEAVERITGMRIGWLSGSSRDWPVPPAPLHRGGGADLALELFESIPRHEFELRATNGMRITLDVSPATNELHPKKNQPVQASVSPARKELS